MEQGPGKEVHTHLTYNLLINLTKYYTKSIYLTFTQKVCFVAVTFWAVTFSPQNRRTKGKFEY